MTDKKAVKMVTVYKGGGKTLMTRSKWLESKKVKDGNKSQAKS